MFVGCRYKEKHSVVQRMNDWESTTLLRQRMRADSGSSSGSETIHHSLN